MQILTKTWFEQTETKISHLANINDNGVISSLVILPTFLSKFIIWTTICIFCFYVRLASYTV